MRIVLDTNVWISALLVPRGKAGMVIDSWRNGSFSIVSSRPIFQEIERVLLYPKIFKRLKLDITKIRQYIDFLSSLTEVIEIGECSVFVEKDHDDSPILETLVTSQSDWLVTGDKVLLELRDRYPIVSVSEFSKKWLSNP